MSCSGSNNESLTLTSYYIGNKEVVFCTTCENEVVVESVAEHACFNIVSIADETPLETNANPPIGNNTLGSETEGSSVSSSFEEMLISLVQARPVLWDSRLPIVNRSKTMKDQAWLDIYKCLNGCQPIEILQKKWRNLRDKFLKVKSETEVLHSGMERKPKKTLWKHFENLRFLNDTVACRPTKTHLDTASPTTSTSSVAEYEYAPKKRKQNESNKAVNDAILETLKMQPPPLPPPTPPAVPPYQGNQICSRLAEILEKLPFRERAKLELEFLTKAYKVATEHEIEI